MPHCVLDPECEHGLHAPDEHSCGRKPEPPGSPCRFCGVAVPLDGVAVFGVLASSHDRGPERHFRAARQQHHR